MIIIYLGNLGSGKTLHAVKDIIENPMNRKTYTNIILPHSIKKSVLIRPEHVIKKTKVDKKIKYDLNMEYWNKQKKPLDVVWDEVHLTANSRMSMSKPNMVLSRFLAMARRITGFDKRGYGHFTFIAQKESTIDKNIKELANEFYYHIGYWTVTCEQCGNRFQTSSEDFIIRVCPVCNSGDIIRSDPLIRVIQFTNIDEFYSWSLGTGTKHRQYIIPNASDYYKYFDTLQASELWDNYVSDSNV